MTGATDSSRWWADPAEDEDAIPVLDGPGPHPLSPAQQRLWYAHEVDPESVEYNVVRVLELRGPLDVAVLRAALHELVRRHPALRTVFTDDGQVVTDRTAVDFVVLGARDGNGLTASEVDDQLTVEATTPFDLRGGPVCRFRLLRSGPERHLLVLGAHHVVVDGWSLDVIVRDLAALHGGVEPPAQRTRLVDVAAWQRNRVADGMREQVEYWRARLAGLEPATLPADLPRPPVRSAAGALHVFEVPPEVTARLREVARDERATLFTLLVAATWVLLARWTGRDDVALATAVADRDRPETEDLVGFLVNTLVLRGEVDESRPFTELLRTAREEVLDAFDHRELPFQRVVEVLRVERDPSRPPLAEVSIALHAGPRPVVLSPGLVATQVRPPVHVSSMDLAFDLVDLGETLEGQLTFTTDLFTSATAARLAGHLVTLLTSVAARPGARVAELPVMDAAERSWVDRLSVTGPVTPARGVADLFADRVRADPAAPAVLWDGGALTYAELDARSTAVAGHLRARGAGPERVIALALPKSVDLVVAVLAVFKTGAAYLPLDQGSPAERLRMVVEDAEPLLAVTSGATVHPLPPHLPVLDLDAPAGPAPAPGGPVAVRPDHAAYVIYTSGSTGRPKGVVVTHAGIAGLVAAQSAHFRTGPGARVLLFASAGFDAAFAELGTALLTGGAAVLGGPDDLLPGRPLAELVARHGVTHLTLPPSALTAMPPDAFPPELTLVVAGEACPPAVAATWSARHRMINAYGPTEATVCATMSDPLTPAGGVPVGRPLAGVRVLVLDDRLRPTPVGVPGEVYLAGPHLARGYLGRPGITAERFVAAPGGRVYRTGDRGRWRPDGALDHLGRVDDQVKLRGYRIELGEVEAALVRHPAVTAAAVVVREDSVGTRRLVAYAVTDPGTAAALRQHVRDLLPEHMVPSVVVPLESLPLNVNGKVDRAALPDPRPRETGGTAPRSDAERALARIWSELLDVPEVGVEDNFFDLGGDSILGLRVVARARDAGLLLTAKQTFLRQTVAELAAVAVPLEVARADERPVTGDVPLTPVQRWFFDVLGDSVDRFTQAVLLELADDVADDALKAAVDALVAHHDALRLRVAWSDGHRVLRHAADASAAFSVVRDGDVEAITGAARLGFDPEVGPLLRAVLFRSAGRPPQLLLVVHHLVVDAVSWRVLLADLHTAHRQVLHGRPLDLGPKSTSFQEWALRLAALTVPDEEARYWAAVEATPVPPLPCDADGPNRAGDMRTVTVEVDQETTAALLRDVPPAFRTRINDVLLAALGRALADWTGGDTVSIALEGHGREDLFEDVDLSRTVGWFTTVHPVVLRVPDTGDWGDLLKGVKEQLRAVPRNGIGHGLLRTPATAVPEVSFNYLGRVGATEEEGALHRSLTTVQGGEYAPRQERPHLVEVNGSLTGGKLVVDWSYSAARHRRATIERVATAFTSALAAMAAHCARPDAGGATPSDFPLVELDQAQVDRVVGSGASARAVRDVYPLTPTQSGMLFHSLADRARDMYTGHFRVRVDGVADPEALARAWQRVVDHTPALRTSVVWRDVPEPVQVVHTGVRLPVVHDDLRAMTGPLRANALAALWERQRRTRLDLAEAPLLRLRIARLSDTGVELFWSSHHIAIDGWSFAHVLSDVFTAYAGGDLPARPAYREHVGWLLGRDSAADEEHWRSVVGDLAAPTPLPFDRQPLGTHAARSSRESVARLSAGRTSALLDAVRERRLTLNSLVQGAWALLLSRYGGGTDVCFGVTTSGRSAGPPGVEDVVGLFANTVPLRVCVDQDRRVADWLRDLQEAQADAREHEHVALARIQRWSALPPGRTLFDSIVVFENYPASEVAGVRVGTPTGDEQTNYALTLTAYLDRGSLHLDLGYDPQLFDETTVQRLLGHLEVVLEGLAAAPDARLDRVPLCTPAEVRQLTEEWNDTAADFPAPVPLHELFARRAAAAPDLVAVRAGADETTYAGLDERANRLAHRLVALGVRPGVLVGVCADRGVGVVAALLAVLKAGGAFVPVDPWHATERLRAVLADSAAPVVITERRFDPVLAGYAGAVVHLEDPFDDLPATPPDVAVAPEDLAYLCYTSGTTGAPKGVMVEHRHVHHMACAWDARHGLSGNSPVVLSVSSLSVDLFFADFVLAALFGGRMVVCPQDRVADQVALADLLVESGATTMVTVPALARAIAAEFAWRGESPSALRLLMVGSEAWPVDSAKEVLAGFAPGTAVVNAYGSTETTVDSTAFRVDRGPSGDAAHVPIGTPLANTWIAVLDERLRPVPTGVVGECYIGGAGVSRGYWNRPGLTARRFVADPNAREPGTRMYRTGDLARWRADGNLDCLGRVDDQVKVRGFRVELGEVESALIRHPAVAAAAATLHRTADGHARLVAHVVPAGGPELPVADLRDFLGDLLPPAAIPSAFVGIAALPLTAGGTVDRRSLPAPGDLSAPAVEHVPPNGPAEELLAEIWSTVLGVRGPGVLDDFFDLGGDSILGIRVISGVRRAFGVALSPRQLFDTPTVRGLARALATTTPEAAPIARRRATGPAPLSSAQARLWFLADFDPDSSEYAIVTALRLHGAVDVEALRTALDAVCARHEPLRTTYRSVDGRPVAVVHPPAPVPLPVVRAAGAEVLDHVAAQPFDLLHGPVLRASLIRSSADEHVLSLVAHHIAVDGWSTDVLVAELSAAYAAALRGEAVELPELPVTYSDYAAWEQESGARADGYWVDRLAGVRPLALPIDRPRPPVRVADGAMLLVDVDGEVLRGLRALARRHDATLFMALVAAVTTLLARWCGQDDLVVGTPTSGRTHRELEGLVGLFVNTVPLRTPVDPDRGFAEHLALVREVVLEAFVHEVPFDRVVDALRPQRDPSRNAVVEVVVGLEVDRAGTPEFAGLRVEPLVLVPSQVSHDLSFDFVESRDGLKVAVGYATTLFDPETARSVADDLVSLLRTVVADPGTTPAGLVLTSGAAVRDLPVAEAVATAGYVAPRTEAEQVVAEVWAGVLGLDRVGVEDNFFDLGGDSLLSIQAVQRVRRAGLAVTTRDLFVHQTVTGLAAVAARPASTVPEVVVEVAPLAPAQAAYLAADPVAPHHFTQSVHVELDPGVDEAALEAAVVALVARHDALRTRFEAGRQRVAPVERVRLRRHDLSGLTERAAAAELDRLAAEADASLDLTAGPVVRALLFDLGSTRRLFLTAHHLVVDAVSWQVLLADLEALYEGADAGSRAPSFSRWAQRLAAHAETGAFDHELDHWERLPVPAPLPRDGDGPNLAGAAAAVAVELDEAETEALLRRAPGVFRARVDHVLLAALARTLGRWTGDRTVVVDLEGHGREHLFDDLDVSRTVGWFTSVYPVALDVPAPEDWAASVRSVRSRLREVPGNGLGYGVLRHVRDRLRDRPDPEVVFNYHGRDGVLESALYRRFLPPVGRERDPAGRADHLLEVVGVVREGRLRFEWHHSVDVHRHETVLALAEDFRDALRDVAGRVRRA
ncbi:non-ribosomal peptide synthetase [Umezawaea beigongshangensis]|uniref:non-ribosomal peptide synthetase n=1 Tax=Umezawaea beigongshangensis TaxID=2780383 RepID=UPI0018F16F28|nr:non-ribosomal peptide synthetase [Umezawaea beigongshangensis]